MDQTHRFHAVLYIDPESNDFTIDRVEHGVSRSGRRITCTPFGRTAEVAMHDQPRFVLRLVDLDFLTFHEIRVSPWPDASPWHAPMREFTNRDRCFVRKDRRHFLIRAPVGAAHSVEKVNRRFVAFCLDAVSECRLHSTLRRATMAPTGGDEREEGYIVSGRGGFNGAPLSGEATAND